MVFKGAFLFFKNTVIFPITRIFGGFNLLSTPKRFHLPIFYLGLEKDLFNSFENPGILSTAG